MSDLEAELAAALEAKSASVGPDPEAWEKHRAAALRQPASTSRWVGHRRVLPLLIAAAVVVVAAVGTSFVVANNSSRPAGPSTPAISTSTIPTTPTAASVTPAPIPAAIGVPTGSASTLTAAVPPASACTGPVVGSAQLHPAGLTGFTARLQLRRGTGGDLLCTGIIGAAGGAVQTSTGGTATGGGPLDLAGSSSWDQGSPVFAWGAVDNRVAGLRINGAHGQAVQVQFTGLPSGRRAFLAVLPPNTKTVTVTATDSTGGTVTTGHFATTFGTPDPLVTTTSTPQPDAPEPTPSAGATSAPTTAHLRTPTTPQTTNLTRSTTSTTAGTRPPPAPGTGCDAPGTGMGIADLGVGSGTVSINYTEKILCFSNGGPLKAAHKLPGVMPYAALTTLVSGQGVWGAVTSKVAKVIITDDNSPKGRPAQLLPLGDNLKTFVEETTGSVRLQAFSSTGALLDTRTPN